MARLAVLTSEFAPFRGGVATYVHEMARAAAGLGWEVEVHAPSYRPFHGRLDAGDRGGAEVVEGASAVEQPYRLRRYAAGLTSPFWLPAYAAAAHRLLRGGYDLIHAADLCALEGLALLVRRRPGPIVATLHGTDVNLATRTRRGRLMARFRPFDCAARLVANSDYTRRLALAQLPDLTPERIVTAPLGVAADCFASANPEHSPAAFSDPARFRILSVGRITARKGQDILLEAVKRLPEALRQRTTVVIAGRMNAQERDFAERLRALAAAASPAQIAFEEGLDDRALRAAYGAADLLCLPGRRDALAVEGFGLVFLEAAAQGMPAVAGDLGGVSEAIEHGVSGLVTPAEDVAALADAIAALGSDPARLVAMGRAAAHRARRFTWERCARLTYGDGLAASSVAYST